MGWEFNLFEGTLAGSDATRLKFAAGPDMPAGYEIHIAGTGLVYDAVNDTLAGTITSLELYDPNFTGNNGVRQSISIAAGDQGTLAASISAFVTSGYDMIGDTFWGWGIMEVPGLHVSGAVFDPAGTFAELELLDETGATAYFLRIEGTGLTDQTFSTTGMISKIALLMPDGTPFGSLFEVDYSAAPHKASAFEYAMLSLGLPDPDGGIQGNTEVLYPVMVAGDNTITKFDNIDSGYNSFEGGAGVDSYEFGPNSDGGGQIDFGNAAGAVTASLSTGIATGGDGADVAWDTNRIAGLGGSNFGDQLTGGSFGSFVSGRGGNDALNGFGGHDVFDGGAGIDTISSGDGDDFIFGGGGGDIVHGGLNAGDNMGGAGDGTDDVLVYAHIGMPPGVGGGVAGLGQAASDYVGGVDVVLTATGAGLVNALNGADDIGLDQFDGIEQVWGTMNDDAFGVDVTFAAGDIAMFTGMGGADAFTGGIGLDIVNYDNEVFSDTIFSSVLAGTFDTGVTVNMSAVTQFGVLAGTATDTFGDTDTLADIDDVYGTAFADILIGDDAVNRLEGKEGADYLDGGVGNDTMLGGLGNDTFVIDSVGDVLIEQGGIDTIHSTFTKTLATGFENLTLLGTGAINATGNSAANFLTGNSASNKLTGGAGRDTLTGGAGSTVRDIFDYNAVSETGKTATTRDRITDFRHLADDIDLSTIDANGSGAGNGKFIFLAAANAAFTGVKGQLHWFQINPTGSVNDKTIIEGDLNGDRRADFQIELTGLKVLSAGDFIL